MDGADPVTVADAVLELHSPVDRGRVMRCCEGCEEVNGEFHEDCCHEWPCPTVEAVQAALLGEADTPAAGEQADPGPAAP